MNTRNVRDTRVLGEIPCQFKDFSYHSTELVMLNGRSVTQSVIKKDVLAERYLDRTVNDFALENLAALGVELKPSILNYSALRDADSLSRTAEFMAHLKKMNDDKAK